MGGKRSTISTSEQRILSLQVQQSSQGLTVPVVYGRTRVSGNLIWYGDFAALQHTTTTRSGKGGGGVTQKDTTYTYEAAIMVALCEGPIKNVVSVWRDKEKHNGLSALGLTLANGTHHQATWGAFANQAPGAVMGLLGGGNGSKTTTTTTRIPSAAGGWDIPAGLNPLTQLHEQEMVLPAEHANTIRGLASAGGGEPIVINATGGDFIHKNDLAKLLKQLNRDFKFK